MTFKRGEKQMTVRKPENHFQKAAMYGMLADFYKYTNPNLHVHYYQKHFKHLQRAIQSGRANGTPSMSESPARVRILHAAPDAPNVDVYINGMRVLKDFSYKKVTDYLNLPKGKYHIDIYPAGNMIATVISKRVTVDSGKNYTLVAAGSGKNLKLLAFEDSPITPPGEAKVRFVHLSPDAPAVDIAVKSGDVIFPNVSFRKSTEYMGLSPMTVDLEARVSGTKTVALALPNITFRPNTAYTIYAVGFANGTPALEVLILSP
jgi:hypothetical protein